MATFLAEHTCVDCGEADVRCLDFDHRDSATKSAEVSVLLGQGHAWSRIRAEMAKCDVRCANCHRRVTADRGQDWRARTEAATAATETAAATARLDAVVGGRPGAAPAVARSAPAEEPAGSGRQV